MKSESLEEEEEDKSQLQFDTVAVQPLHADPQVQELARSLLSVHRVLLMYC